MNAETAVDPHKALELECRTLAQQLMLTYELRAYSVTHPRQRRTLERHLALLPELESRFFQAYTRWQDAWAS